MKKQDCDKSPFIAIPASLGGIILVITIMFLTLGKEFISQIGTIVWGLVVLGIVALGFAYKVYQKK